MVFDAEKEIPKASLFEIVFEQHLPFEEDKTIFVDGSDATQALTFKHVKHQVLCIAEGLQNTYGLKRGDTVAIYSPNDILFPVVAHGIVAAGGITVPIDPTGSAEFVASDIDQVGARILITHEKLFDKALEGARMANEKIDLSRILVFGDQRLKGVRTVKEVLIDHGMQGTPVRYEPDELNDVVAYLYFTSGSTGRKKAVKMTHSTMANIFLPHCVTSAVPDDVGLSYTAFDHVTSLLVTFHAGVYCGAKTVIISEYSLESFCTTVQEFKITYSLVQPWVLSSLAREPLVNNYDISSLRALFFAGATLDKSVLSSLKDRCKARVFNVYGLTEAVRIFEVTPEISMKGSVGKRSHDISVRVVKENGEDAGIGERGELWVKGPTVTPGYYKNPEATAEAIDVTGYFHTGDIFTYDEEGFFYFMGRHKSLIRYYEYDIFPGALEDMIVSHPKVTDCGVIGVYSHEEATEFLRAYVTIKDDEDGESTAHELQKFVEERVDDHLKLRGGVFIVKNFPRTSAGKIKRQLLSETSSDNIVASTQ